MSDVQIPTYASSNELIQAAEINNELLIIDLASAMGRRKTIPHQHKAVIVGSKV